LRTIVFKADQFVIEPLLDKVAASPDIFRAE
jgi:hypothetical protein